MLGRNYQSSLASTHTLPLGPCSPEPRYSINLSHTESQPAHHSALVMETETIRSFICIFSGSAPTDFITSGIGEPWMPHSPSALHTAKWYPLLVQIPVHLRTESLSI